MTEDPRYPVGQYEPQPYSEKLKDEWMADIRFLPNAIESAINGLNEQQLQTPYRDGGWTAHQVVHHVADSDMNAYIRFKLGYTEEHPGIKPYDENKWAVLSDVKELPVNISITLLYALHHRWNEFLRSINKEEWNRTVFHPGHNKDLSLWYLLGSYAWHGRHHTAHITSLRERMKW